MTADAMLAHVSRSWLRAIQHDPQCAAPALRYEAARYGAAKQTLELAAAANRLQVNCATPDVPGGCSWCGNTAEEDIYDEYAGTEFADTDSNIVCADEVGCSARHDAQHPPVRGLLHGLYDREAAEADQLMLSLEAAGLALLSIMAAARLKAQEEGRHIGEVPDSVVGLPLGPYTLGPYQDPLDVILASVSDTGSAGRHVLGAGHDVRPVEQVPMTDKHGIPAGDFRQVTLAHPKNRSHLLGQQNSSHLISGSHPAPVAGQRVWVVNDGTGYNVVSQWMYANWGSAAEPDSAFAGAMRSPNDDPTLRVAVLSLLGWPVAVPAGLAPARLKLIAQRLAQLGYHPRAV